MTQSKYPLHIYIKFGAKQFSTFVHFFQNFQKNNIKNFFERQIEQPL